MTSPEPLVDDVVSTSREGLLDRLEATDTDAVRAVDTGSMTVGLKRYDEHTANGKRVRKHGEDELYYALSRSGQNGSG